MRFIYNVAMIKYSLLIRLVSLFSTKARKWVSGRRNIFQRIEKTINSTDRVIWMHTASLGEFEQGRPVLEKLREEYPDHKLVLTFFSPSGYEIRKDYDQVDHVFYLPMDTARNAKRFVNLLNPEVAIFVKYEFWFNYLKELHLAESKIFFISAIFRKEQYFFKWFGKWFQKHLRWVNHYFVQNTESVDLLSSIGITNVCVSGDTRFDRVFDLAQHAQKFPLIEKFKNGKQLFIAGSTWPPDEEILYPFVEKNPEVKFIIAPHDVREERIKQITRKMGSKALRFSQVSENNISDCQVLIIDSIGILAHLYQYADLCYIGGGFGVAIHNIQEPVTFGTPVLFGPKYHRFREAVDLIERGGAFTVNDEKQLDTKTNNLLSDSQLLQKASDICIQYVDEMRGATRSIMRIIKTYITK